MKLIIDISDNLYNVIKSDEYGLHKGKMYDIIRNGIPLDENKGEWIPVSERLPKVADVYRVTRYYPNNVMNPTYLVDACCFDGSNTWYDDNRINHERAYVDNIIAWQENPEPYKVESEYMGGKDNVNRQ